MSTPIHPAIANLSPKRLAAGIYWERSWNVVRGCSKVSPTTSKRNWRRHEPRIKFEQ